MSVDLGRRRLLRSSVARGPVRVLLVLGFIRVSAVATLPPRPEADLADHARSSTTFDGSEPAALALPADAELVAQGVGTLQTPRPTRAVAELCQKQHDRCRTSPEHRLSSETASAAFVKNDNLC